MDEATRIEMEDKEAMIDSLVEVCAIYHGALVAIMNELGVPQSGYPEPVANAYEIAQRALNIDAPRK